MSNATAEGTQSLISVVVPAHNEQGFIEKCIASIKDADWPAECLEILVIDHRSTDATAEVARRAGARVIRETGTSIGAVRNAGLKAARGEFVAYVDADCTVPRNWLSTAISILHSDPSIGAVGGPCLSPDTGSWVERALACSSCPPGIIRPAKELATSSFISRTHLLRELGMFNESLISGEDDEMSYRIRRRGLLLISASDCHIVHHGYARTWWQVAERELWHGSNHVDVSSEMDLTLIFTHVFIIASAALPVLAIWALLAPSTFATSALLAVLSCQLLSPLLFGLKRLRAGPRDWPYFPRFVAVGYAYFAGHSAGVIANYLRRGRLSQA